MQSLHILSTVHIVTITVLLLCNCSDGNFLELTFSFSFAKCTRNGGPNKLCLESFAEALNQSASGLTYPALVGSRKQSVEDAERLFSPSLLIFMEDKDYQYEARYICAILGWRQACDEGGLSE